MNKRQARRMATQEVAFAALSLAGSAELRELAPADRIRLRDAFCALACELQVRADQSLRAATHVPEDPDQYAIFPLEKK